MGFISEILGISKSSESKPRGIGDVEAALARLREEQSAAKEAVAAAMRTREELLVVDETDKKIASLDTAADRHRLTLERCEKLEPLLRAELQSLQTEARRQRWRETTERYDMEARAFAAAFRVAFEKWQSLIAMRGEAISRFSQTEVGGLTVPPNVLAEDVLHRFESELDRQRDFAARPARPSRQPSPAADGVGNVQSPRRVDLFEGRLPAKPVASQPSAPGRLDPSADGSGLHRKLDRELSRLGAGDVPKGHVGIRLLVSDIDIGDQMLWRGDEIAVPALQGRRLVENNAAEYIDPAPAPKAPPAAGESDGAR